MSEVISPSPQPLADPRPLPGAAHNTASQVEHRLRVERGVARLLILQHVQVLPCLLQAFLAFHLSQVVRHNEADEGHAFQTRFAEPADHAASGPWAMTKLL